VLLCLPLPAVFALGRLIGAVFYFNGKKRRVAFKNIKSAFPEKDRRQIQSILKRSFYNFGLSIVESLIGPRIYKYSKIKGEENILPEGGIFVGIHAGNWEAAISSFARKYNFAALAKPQKHKGLDKFLNELRKEGKTRVCFSLKELIRCLRQNYMIGMVIDHGAEIDAPFVEFFSHLVATPKGAVHLAKKFNKKIYTTFSHHQGGFFHVLEIGKPISSSGRNEGEILRYLNKIYEGHLQKYPWEYFWYYKRFKHKMNRDALILSDGRPGHLKQSRALLALLSEEKYKIKSATVDIKYRNKFCRIIADILACFSGKHSLLCGRYLSFLIDREVWEKLNRIYADIVISTGSYIAPVNKLFSSYLGAKSAVIMRPNIPLRQFDLAIVPEHDRITAKNSVVIKGALSYFKNSGSEAEKCKTVFNLSEAEKISFFVGGPVVEKREFFNNLKIFVSGLKNFSHDRGYKLLVSTSRRTSAEIEAYLEEELKNFVNTEALVIANRSNYDFVFGGFSALGNIVFVGSDSVSMISEIVSLKKPCVCVSFEIEDAKRKVFLESIKDEVIFLRKPYVLEDIKLKIPSIFEKNREAVRKGIGGLLK